MNLKTYQEQATRTCPDLGSEAINLAHMVLGIFSEYNEFFDAVIKNDKVNISEEITDKYWYLSNYCTIREYDLETLHTTSFDLLEDEWYDENYEWFTELIVIQSHLQDLVKKNLAYGKEIDRVKEEELLKRLLLSIHFLGLDYSYDMDKSLQNNIDKLRKRFPDKFDKEKAINRDLEAERVELEK